MKDLKLRRDRWKSAFMRRHVTRSSLRFAPTATPWTCTLPGRNASDLSLRSGYGATVLIMNVATEALCKAVLVRELLVVR